MEFSTAQVDLCLSYERLAIHSCLDYLAPKSCFLVKGLPFGAYAPLTGETGILVSSPGSRKGALPDNGIYSYTCLIWLYKILDTRTTISSRFHFYIWYTSIRSYCWKLVKSANIKLQMEFILALEFTFSSYYVFALKAWTIAAWKNHWDPSV